MRKSWPHFSAQELVCHCGCGRHGMDKFFMQVLENLRVDYGKPIVITSAYRCGPYNDKIGKTGVNGPHTTGMAVDIKTSGNEVYELLALAVRHEFTGIGILQAGPIGKRFIHLDKLMDCRPRLWTYT